MATSSSPRVIVVGAGVVGISTAIQLLRALYKDVTIIARDFSPLTTSDGAGAIWRPFGVEGGPQTPSLVKWGDSTWNHLSSLMTSLPHETAGVSLVGGYEVSAKPFVEKKPFWSHTVVGFRNVDYNELKTILPLSSPYRYGYAYSSLVIDVTVYLPLLYQTFIALGGKIIDQHLNSLSELPLCDLVINCTGLGARQLVNDNHVHPVRGHIVRVQAPFVHMWWMSDDGEEDGKLMYIFPRRREVVLGGTYVPDNWSKVPTKEVAQEIIDRCSNVYPELQSAPIVQQWIGLRPSRDSIRIEADTNGITIGERRVPLIHNYGHGGSGITLHWGCADDAVALALRACPPSGSSSSSSSISASATSPLSTLIISLATTSGTPARVVRSRL